MARTGLVSRPFFLLFLGLLYYATSGCDSIAGSVYVELNAGGLKASAHSYRVGVYGARFR